MNGTNNKIMYLIKIKIFDLLQTGSFSVTGPFLTTFYYVEKQNGILLKNRGKGFEKSYVRLHGGRGGVKNCQNHPYVSDEWPLSSLYNHHGSVCLCIDVLYGIYC